MLTETLFNPNWLVQLTLCSYRLLLLKIYIEFTQFSCGLEDTEYRLLTNHPTVFTDKLTPSSPCFKLYRSTKSKALDKSIKRAALWVLLSNETIESFNTAVDVLCFFLKPDWSSEKAFLEDRNSFNWSITSDSETFDKIDNFEIW